MRRSLVLILVLAVLLPVTIVASILISTAIGGSITSMPAFGRKVGLVRIEGVIFAGRGAAGLFSSPGAGSERVIKALERARRDGSVKSLVIRVNSPGGSAAASQEIYDEIRRVRRSGKKVTVSMGDVAASGGYYVAAAADRIYADPATLTGSIGVIIETTDLHVLLDKLGIELGAVKSGEHKDMGSIARPLTAEERRILQGVIDDVFDQFVTAVHEGRKLPVAAVRKLADGRIFTGSQAKKLKLVDELGGLEDALKAAARDAGIKGDFEVEEYESRGFFEQLLGETESHYLGRGRADALLRLARALLLRDEVIAR